MFKLFAMQYQLMNDDSEEIYETYKAEAAEILTQLRRSFETLKKRSDSDALNEIILCSHKLKGVAGVMDYSHIEELAKEMESVAKVLANRKVELKPETLSGLLEAFALLTKYIETDFGERDPVLLEKLRKLGTV